MIREGEGGTGEGKKYIYGLLDIVEDWTKNFQHNESQAQDLKYLLMSGKGVEHHHH